MQKLLLKYFSLLDNKVTTFDFLNFIVIVKKKHSLFVKKNNIR